MPVRSKTNPLRNILFCFPDSSIYKWNYNILKLLRNIKNTKMRPRCGFLGVVVTLNMLHSGKTKNALTKYANAGKQDKSRKILF